jgi:selenophosphate synthase
LDFFTPIVDDPFDFGAIAAANALSDAYAMGARPIFALNIVGFPEDVLPLEVLEQILKGAQSKAEGSGDTCIGRAHYRRPRAQVWDGSEWNSSSGESD